MNEVDAAGRACAVTAGGAILDGGGSTSPMARLAALEKFLLSAFDATELRIWLRHVSPDDVITPRLPGVTASLAQLVAETVAILERERLLDDAAFWAALIAVRRRREGEIVAIRDLASPPGPVPDLLRSEPIRILFVLSCPRQREQLATQEEIRRIRDELERAPHRDRFAHELVIAATYGHLRRKLRSYQPHILHIACHGAPGAQLILDDGDRGEERIDAATLVELLEVLKKDLRLVVVSACHSTSITGQLAPLVGLVVGMKGAVDDESAVSFAQVFYESIAAGDSVETSYRLGVNELHRRRLDADLPELLPASGPLRAVRFVLAT